MRRRFVRCGAVAVLAGATLSVHGQGRQAVDTREFQLLHVMRDSGRNVAPVFEGWEPGADGVFRLYFGYMNRNWKEECDIPIGAENSFEPGPADRGQPTHFLTRRHKQVFSVVVPKDFSGPLVWRLTVRGATDRVTASLAPDQQISVSKDLNTGNAPPKLTMPASRTSPLPLRATLSAVVNDDGLPKPNAPGARSLHVTWAKYRGPGVVTFAPASMLAARSVGVRTSARFSEPGTYMIQATADDGSIAATSDGSSIPGLSCCWISGVTTITVKPAQTLVRSGSVR